MTETVDIINKVTQELSSPGSYNLVSHRSTHDIPMPSVQAMEEVVEGLRAVIFPGYFGSAELSMGSIPYYVGAKLDSSFRLLCEQIKRGLCFDGCDVCHQDCPEKSREIAERFIERLPEIRRLLTTDVVAAYEGDPAAKSYGESIFCYPSIKALTNYRVAHELYRLEVPIIPRIISEMAHSETGIDIHPGASIGEGFFMDHGTGIVIGETAIIGRNVRIYQGVTLGAKSFPVDEQGHAIKGIPRHPIVEDGCIIYSGATILGRVTIGSGTVVGGNVWLTHSVPAHSKIMQGELEVSVFGDGGGI